MLRAAPGGLTVSGCGPLLVGLAAYPPLGDLTAHVRHRRIVPAHLTAPGAAVSGSLSGARQARRDRAAWAAMGRVFVFAPQIPRPPLPAPRVVTLRSAPSMGRDAIAMADEHGGIMIIFLGQDGQASACISRRDQALSGPAADIANLLKMTPNGHCCHDRQPRQPTIKLI